MTTVWQDNAVAFASRPDDHIDQERRSGVREALALIVAGKPGEAQYRLTRSVQAAGPHRRRRHRRHPRPRRRCVR